MRYNINIQHLQKDQKYPDAISFLSSIIKGDLPSKTILANLYGAELVEIVYSFIKNFLQDKSYSKRTPRLHQSAPSEIDEQRTALETNSNFQAIQSKLLYNQLPDEGSFEPLYGEYSAAIRKVFGLFIQLGLIRLCGISATAHYNRVAGAVWGLKMDNENIHKYTAVAGLHDAIEDLLNILKDKKGRVYGIHRYDEFVEDFIPKELQEHVKLLTNNYDLILGHINQQFIKTDRSMTKKNLLNAIEVQHRRNSGELGLHFEKMHELLYNSDIKEDIYKNAKWRCYENLYIHDMAISTKEMNDYRTFQIKAVDLLDNAHGRDSLSMEGRIRNIIKLGIWASQGYNLQSDWLPLNDFVMEVYEEALVHAEHLVIKDLFEPQSQQDFLVSALIKFEKLSPIFYSDYKH